jgi:hypothetical protein
LEDVLTAEGLGIEQRLARKALVSLDKIVESCLKLRGLTMLPYVPASPESVLSPSTCRQRMLRILDTRRYHTKSQAPRVLRWKAIATVASSSATALCFWVAPKASVLSATWLVLGI